MFLSGYVVVWELHGSDFSKVSLLTVFDLFGGQIHCCTESDGTFP